MSSSTIKNNPTWVHNLDMGYTTKFKRANALLCSTHRAKISMVRLRIFLGRNLKPMVPGTLQSKFHHSSLTVAEECLRLWPGFLLIPTPSSSGSSGVPGSTRLDEVLLFEDEVCRKYFGFIVTPRTFGKACFCQGGASK